MTADRSQDNTPATGRYVEDAGVSFVMWCDTNGLSMEEGQRLAEQIAETVIDAAESRADYLGEGGAA